MRWIIRHNPSEKYICSKRLTVCNREMARKFNSIKQARIYLGGSIFRKEHCSVIEYYRDLPGFSAGCTEDEISEKIASSINDGFFL